MVIVAMKEFDFNNGKIKVDLSNKSRFTLVSYYWGENKVNKGSINKLTYSQQVERLIEDCKRMGVNYYFVLYSQLETINYQEALGLKPRFIQHCLNTLPEFNCIFVDTDLRLKSYPYLLEADSDCWFINWNEFDFDCYNPLQLELPGGIMGFANTETSKKLLKILSENLNPRYAEDKTFSGIITRYFLNTYARCVWLPSTYLYMFDRHEYTPKVGYTKIASYKEELRGTGMKERDLVFVHEDFETGALDDIYNERIKVNRYPPKTDKYLGEKLRCYNVKFKIYSDWGLTKKQAKQYRFDWKDKEKYGIAKVTTLKDYKPQKFRVLRHKKMGETNVLAKVDKRVDEEVIEKFCARCEREGMGYTIIRGSAKANIAYIIYEVMRRYRKNVLLLDINSKPVKVKIGREIDMMCYNMNNDFKESGCYDPRILRTVDGGPLYLRNNEMVRGFLRIWGEYVRRMSEHKALEYAFNISEGLNRLRCRWMKRGEIKRFKIQLREGAGGESKVIRRLMEQCGAREARGEGVRESHRHGSRYGKEYRNKYEGEFK